MSDAMAEAEAKITETVRHADEKLSEALERAEQRRRDMEKTYDQRLNELTAQLAETSRQVFEEEVASHQRTSQSWAEATRKARDDRAAQIAQHDQALADAARTSAESAIAAHVRVRGEEARITAAQIERMEKENGSLQAQVQQLSEQLRVEKGNAMRVTAEMTDSQSTLQHQKETAEARVVDLTQRLQEESEACAKMRESLVYMGQLETLWLTRRWRGCTQRKTTCKNRSICLKDELTEAAKRTEKSKP